MVAACVYAASIVVPARQGARTWMWVDVIVVPLLVLIAYAVLLGERNDGGDLHSSGWVPPSYDWSGD